MRRKDIVHTYVGFPCPEKPSEGRHPCFGELALMYAKPRAASVAARTDGVLWGLGRANFRKVQTWSNAIDLLKLLRSVTIFEMLRVDQLQELRDAMTEEKVDEGEYVMRQGEGGDSMYIVISGTASVQINKPGVQLPQEVMQLSHPDYFGERALIDLAPRAADVLALEPMELVRPTIAQRVHMTRHCYATPLLCYAIAVRSYRVCVYAVYAMPRCA